MLSIHREVTDIDMRLENQAMRAPAVMEHPELLSSPDALTDVNRDLCGTDFMQADTDESDTSDVRIIRRDDDHGPAGETGEFRLTPLNFQVSGLDRTDRLSHSWHCEI
jgi:hypothetical protein